ncbi:MAG: redoxin domain-containing protein [Bacteroidia bacterium]|nr:redoxin domain-containing protein [Bacteroidia bacterium]
MPAAIGNKAPDFELPDTNLNMVALDSLKGNNVVLLFFPAVFSSVCTKALRQTNDELKFYDGLNAKVFGISVDGPFALAKFRELFGVNFTLLSDFNKKAITAYGCKYATWIAGMKGVSKRASFVIDRNGIVRFAQILEKAGDYPDFEGIKKTLKALGRVK